MTPTADQVVAAALALADAALALDAAILAANEATECVAFVEPRP